MTKTPKAVLLAQPTAPTLSTFTTFLTLSNVSQDLTHLLKTADATTKTIIQPALDVIDARLALIKRSFPKRPDAESKWFALSAEDALRIRCQFNMHECGAQATHCQHVSHSVGNQSSVSFGYACSVHTAKVQDTGKWFDTESMI